MPREDRTIIFSPREVHEALEGFAQRQNMPMPQGTLDAVSFEAGAEPALTVSIKPLGRPVAQRIAFRKAEVAAALILYCRAQKVPLPKNCRKELIAHDGVPAFHITLE